MITKVIEIFSKNLTLLTMILVLNKNIQKRICLIPNLNFTFLIFPTKKIIRR